MTPSSVSGVFIAAVALIAWHAGIGVGVLAALTLAVAPLWLPPETTSRPGKMEVWNIAACAIQAAIYVATACISAYLASRMRHTQRTMEENQRLFITVLQELPAGVVIARAPSGEVVFASERVNSARGGSGGTAPSVDPSIQLPLRHPDGRPYAMEEYPLTRSARYGERVADESIQYVRPDGGMGVMCVNSVPLYDTGHHLIAAAATFQDITQQTRVHQNQEFLYKASTALADSLEYEETLQRVAELTIPALANVCVVHVFDGNGGSRRVAVGADKAEEAVVRELLERFPVELDRPQTVIGEVQRTRASVLVAEVTEEWMRAHSRNEEYFELLQRLGPTSYMCVPLEIHERMLGAIVLIRTQLQRRYDEMDLALAEELGRRAAMAVDHARLYQEARALLAAKDRFLAMLSHEVRNPLTPALMAASLLRRRDDLPPELREMASVIERNVELEVRLIDDLLDVTRINSDKLRLQMATMDAHTAVREAVEVCRQDVEQRQLRLTMELGAKEHHVLADDARLQQVCWNLLKNAVKFTPPRGLITVRTWNEGMEEEADEEQRQPALVIEVSDTGAGIAPERLAHIFNAFEQESEQVTYQHGGLGLGLTISKGIVEGHGGTISAESGGKGKGTTIRVRIPTVPASTARPAEVAPQAPSVRNESVRVLLVEDHEDTARLMTKLLESYQFHVTTAGSMAEAMAAGEQSEFDLLISDIGLPDGCGLDLLRQLSHRQRLNGIALSGYGMETDVQRTRAAGFAEHLVKPIDVLKLEAALRRVLERVEGAVVPKLNGSGRAAENRR